MSWRIELGAATPIMERMYEAQQEAKDLGEDAQKEKVREAGVQARKEVLTPEVLADHAMRLRSVHPGTSVDEVVAQTGFALVVPATVPATREPSAEELQLLRERIDPNGLRDRQVRS